jgi:hypothetical protein
LPAALTVCLNIAAIIDHWVGKTDSNGVVKMPDVGNIDAGMDREKLGEWYEKF